jgi:methylated-DNA-[protein]-cysteine S-methyltransferase
MTEYTEMKSPIGVLTLVKEDEDAALSGLYMEAQSLPRHVRRCRSATRFAEETRQLAEYFDGVRQQFDLVLSVQGTPFQRRVWSALRAIPFARTVSYAAIARAIDKPKAFRAVGAANGLNPISIVVPCHRVIGSSGALVGYGGGIARKTWLLSHERSLAAVHADDRNAIVREHVVG